MTFLKEDRFGNVLLNVYIQPRASSNKICGIHGDALKIRITSPPVENKANVMVIKFLAKFLGVPPSYLSLVKGKQSRNKRVMVAKEKADLSEIKNLLCKMINP